MENIEGRVRREVRAMKRREVMTKAIAGQLTWMQAAQVLGITPRHLGRIRQRYQRWGISALMDQRGGRPRRKRIKPGTVELLIRLKRDVYPDFSVRHFYEHVTEKHQVRVSYNWLRLMLQEGGVVEKEPARGKYRRGRERRPMVGLLVHLDASTHEWIVGLPRQDLVVALDDADGRILYGRCFAQEGTASTFAALEGCCAATVASWSCIPTFCRTAQAGQGPAEEQNGQVAQAQHALGIRQILARSSQARGRSERAFGTIQGRRRRPDQAPRRRSDANLVFDRENAEPACEELLDETVFLVVQGRAVQVRDSLEVIDFHSVGGGFDEIAVTSVLHQMCDAVHGPIERTLLPAVA